MHIPFVYPCLYSTPINFALWQVVINFLLWSSYLDTAFAAAMRRKSKRLIAKKTIDRNGAMINNHYRFLWNLSFMYLRWGFIWWCRTNIEFLIDTQMYGTKRVRREQIGKLQYFVTDLIKCRREFFKFWWKRANHWWDKATSSAKKILAHLLGPLRLYVPITRETNFFGSQNTEKAFVMSLNFFFMQFRLMANWPLLCKKRMSWHLQSSTPTRVITPH